MTGLQLIALVGYHAASARCTVCEQAFRTDTLVPALCHEAEVVGVVCPGCLTPSEQAGFYTRLEERRAGDRRR